MEEGFPAKFDKVVSILKRNSKVVFQISPSWTKKKAPPHQIEKKVKAW